MSNLITDGYYVGKNSELFSDLTVFQNYCTKINNLTEDKNNFKYRFDYKYPAPYSMYIGLDEIKEREKFVKDNKINTFQRWWQYSGTDLTHIKNYFRENVVNFLTAIYGDMGELTHMDDITLFENGDFIDQHKDGYNEGRICVVLIYLSDSKTYQDGGGKLVIKNKDFIEEVYPINENFTILDFTQNNVTHVVTTVKNDFKRLTYINFISKK
jgi:Rps23 Pro-64 3,4-dihydroxylase Tpa1-like proline 4-hydroxylase